MTEPGTLSINLELPIELVERLNEAAARSDRSLEVVLVESLLLLFGTTQADRGRCPMRWRRCPMPTSGRWCIGGLLGHGARGCGSCRKAAGTDRSRTRRRPSWRR